MTNSIDSAQYKTWLESVRKILIELNVLTRKSGKPYRQMLFKNDLVLDEKSWYSYFESKLMPFQAVKEDLELPFIEYKPHRIL